MFNRIKQKFMLADKKSTILYNKVREFCHNNLAYSSFVIITTIIYIGCVFIGIIYDYDTEQIIRGTFGTTVILYSGLALLNIILLILKCIESITNKKEQSSKNIK